MVVNCLQNRFPTYYYINKYVPKNVFSFAKIHIFPTNHNISIHFFQFSPFSPYDFLKNHL